MKTDTPTNITPVLVFAVYVLLVAGVLVQRILVAASDPIEGMTNLNDDTMRLLSVRDWMAGQNWFDMTQYRVLPPDGLSLHWSRYVDVAIFALIKFFALFVADETAETLAIVLWPQLQLLVLIALTAWAGNKILGAWPTATAILAILLWPIMSVGYFEPLRLDHHNIQMLLMTVVIVTLILPTSSVRLGIVGGLAAGMSLAIGMENLILVALAGIVLSVGAILNPTIRAGQLAAFGVTLGLSSVALHIGQTHPDEWFVQQCDKLSPPFLALTVTAAIVSVILSIGCKRLTSLNWRIGLLLGCATVAAAIVIPVFYPCLSGPYGNVPKDLQLYIHNAIGETRSALYLFTNLSLLFNWIIVPALWAVTIAAIVWIVRLRDPEVPITEKRAVGILLLFGVIGVGLSLMQLRMIVLAAPPIPLLAGYGIYAVFSARKKSNAHGLGILALVLIGSVSFFYPTIIKKYMPGSENEASETVAANSGSDLACDGTEAMKAIAELPTGIVFARDQISTSILLTSDHFVVGVPYHRSVDALNYVFISFLADEEGFRADLDRSGADYLVLCRNKTFGGGSSFASQLATGEVTEPVGLEALPLPENSPLLAFRVAK